MNRIVSREMRDRLHDGDAEGHGGSWRYRGRLAGEVPKIKQTVTAAKSGPRG
jgi:hypothetical protein